MLFACSGKCQGPRSCKPSANQHPEHPSQQAPAAEEADRQPQGRWRSPPAKMPAEGEEEASEERRAQQQPQQEQRQKQSQTQARDAPQEEEQGRTKPDEHEGPECWFATEHRYRCQSHDRWQQQVPLDLGPCPYPFLWAPPAAVP